MSKKKDTRPLIGINMDLLGTNRGEQSRSVILSGYYDSIFTAGGIPVMLAPSHREADLLPVLERLDGLVLIGGADLDPRVENTTFHPAVRKMADRREQADRLLCRLAERQKLTTLAIGVGMQEMNVEHGGGLFVHLPEDLPRCLPHFDPQGGIHRHIVTMEPGTTLEAIYGEDPVCVNSYHHQGVRKLASMFRPSAHAPDGLLEAYEHHDMDEWWCVGVQWHPENEGHITLDTQLLEAFIEAAGRGVRAPLKLAKAG